MTTNNNQLSTDVIASSCAAIGSRILFAPVQRVWMGQAWYKTKFGDSTTFWNSLRRIYQEEGFFAFWRGNITNLMNFSPGVVMRFVVKESFKRHVCNDRKLNCTANVVSGGVAGLLTVLPMHPFSVVRREMYSAVNEGSRRIVYSGWVDCMRTIVKSNGLPALYKGFAVPTLQSVSFYGIYFGMYDSFCQKNSWNDQHTSSWVTRTPCNFTLAMCSTVTAMFVTYPVSLVRFRVKEDHLTLTRMVSVIGKMVQQEGVTSLWKGIQNSLPRSILSALVLVMFDEIKRKM